MIELDGAYLEGGGALVRVALALSTITEQPFKVTNIRAGRPNPGLKAQHLTSIKALQALCNAKTSDVKLGITEFWYHPGKIKKGKFDIDIGTAGSITLLLQALILPSLFAPGKVTFTIKGGTCGKWQASVDYLQNILLPYLRRFVDSIEIKILKRGYYPKGGGEIVLEIKPRFHFKEFDNFNLFFEELQFKTPPIQLIEQGKLEQIRGVINASLELQDKDVAERIKHMMESMLRTYEVPINIRNEYTHARSIGGEAIVWALFSTEGKMDYDNPIILGGDALIEQGKSSEQIGKEAVNELKKHIDSETAVDEHLADQLIQFMGLRIGSKIKVEKITNHTKTNMYVAEKFLPVGFKVQGKIISVEGKD
ncbi:RNA 3'-phosphate cyclase [Candidatus Woesearchaeota archaeon CG10_big_fil_rev_8_21_14_0_10_32_24]|nr:MAG: RNA 3'-phosphate cyclase [Candidatus Woesearchaeota archaeon CG10_big_fil_rev_8_21_14_0_10_32_24]